MNYHGGPGQGMVPPQFSNGATHYHQPQMFPPQGMQMEMHGGHGMMPPQQQQPPPPQQMGAGQHQGGEGPPGPESDYKHQSSVLAEQSGVSTTAFDSVEELLWIGTNAGYISSYYGPNLQRYTAFRVHTNSPVIQVLPSQLGIYTLTANDVRCYTRFGRCSAEFGGEDFHSMQCITHTPNNSVLVGGHQPYVFELDMASLAPVNKYMVDDVGVAIIKASNRHLLFGDTSGKITLRDPRSLGVEHSFQAHSGTLSDFDSHNNQIVTCGFSAVRGNLQLDRFLMVYDMRMMRSISPIQCNIEPYYLKFVPTYTSKIFVVSHSGQYQVMDTGAMTSASLVTHQIGAATGPITAFDVSTSQQHVSFGDANGCFHLYSSVSADGGSPKPFNPYSQETQFADVTERLPAMSIDDPMVPYSSIPMPYPGQGALLSDWPQAYTQQVYRKPMPIDPAIMNNVKMSGNIGYAKVPDGSARRFPYQQSDQGQGGGRHRGGGGGGHHHHHHSKKTKGHVPASPIGRGDDPFMSVPKQYRKVEIKYSKLGVEDFDFRHYNKTHFAGLETHIPNAYCNSMLQVLYFIEPLRATLLNHLCQNEFCLACELGFLFHMLDVSKGMTCQASNFLRAFRTIPDASALGLNLGDDDESSKKNLARIIQNWSRFVLQQIHTELNRKDTGMPNIKEEEKTEPEGDVASVVQKLFGASNTTRLVCKCGEVSNRDTEAFMFNMIYPDAPVDVPNFEFPMMPFSQVIANSMNASQSLQSWCDKCNKYQPHSQNRVLKNVPDVIGLNVQVDNDTTLDFWKRQLDLIAREHEQNAANTTPTHAEQTGGGNKRPCRYGTSCTRADCYFYHEGRDDIGGLGGHVPKGDPPAWVPLGIAIKLLPDGQVTVSDVKNPYEKCSVKEGEVVYELLASVAHIREPKTGGNLVAHVHVGETYHQRKEGVTTTQFYLFNDFSIVDIEKEESVKFNMEWKWPCALFFVKKKFNSNYKIQVRSPFENYESLFSQAALASDRARSMTNIPLSGEEKLVPGDVVGIDAEFVSLNQEESELRSDGTKSTIKPPQMSVARVTCIRGQGSNLDKDLYLKPFMDDYISTQEEVVDYLTQFSGIKPGDLDKAMSSKHLTTLKSLYIRLRYMVDKGVIFVGHGLKKDFRVINIVIPPKQVFDTVELFYLPRQRMISLKFLAWYYLGENIQSDTHDSIEDAQTALKLYFKYKELDSKGNHEAKKSVIDLYDRGRIINWKVPENAKEGLPGIDISMEDLKTMGAAMAAASEN